MSISAASSPAAAASRRCAAISYPLRKRPATSSVTSSRSRSDSVDPYRIRSPTACTAWPSSGA
jgi:hypothetical protein